MVTNSYKKWSEINVELPDYPIEVLGLLPTDGKQKVFVELAVKADCKT